MRKIILLFSILAMVLIFGSCSDTGAASYTNIEYVPGDPSTAELVGDIQLIGEWVRQSTNDRRTFTDHAEFTFEHALTGEISYSGTFYAHDGQIDFTEADGTEFVYLYEIIYDSPTVNSAELVLWPGWITNPTPVVYRKIIPGVYEYP